MFSMNQEEKAATLTNREVIISNLTGLLAGLTGRLPLTEHVGVVVDGLIAEAKEQAKSELKKEYSAIAAQNKPLKEGKEK